MVGRNQPQAEEVLKRIKEAIDAGDSQKAAESYGDLITLAEKSGELDRAKSQSMRLDLAAQMIRMAPPVSRGKVTLSLPDDLLTALRIASAESGKEMSFIVGDALRTELQNYAHASQALRKTT